MGYRLLALFLVRGSCYGAIGPFATVLLIGAHLPATLIGPVAAAGSVLTLLFAPTWGRLGDRHGRRRVLVLAFLIGVPSALAQASGALPLVAAGYIGWAIAASAWVPLIDSLTLARLGGSRSRYAKVRIGGSLGYALMSLATGAVIT